MSRTEAAHRLEKAALALLCVTTALVPLAWGGFRPAGRLALLAGWGVGGLLWLLALALAGRRPAVPRAALLAAAALACLAGWAAVRTLPEPADAFTERHLERLETRWPASFQRPAAPVVAGMTLAALLAGVAMADLGRRRTARFALAAAVLAGGLLTAVVGLVHNAAGVDTIYGEAMRVPGRSFGAFFHHTAAGAQLNLALPLALMVLVGLVLRQRKGVASPLWAWLGGGLAVVILAAAHAGNIARLPPVVGLLGAAVAVLLACWWREGSMVASPEAAARSTPGRQGRLRVLLAALAVLAMGAGLVTFTHRLGHTGERWRDLTRQDERTGLRKAPPPVEEWEARLRADYLIPSDFRGVFLQDRGAAWAVAGRAIAARPVTGWGPGGWASAASHHTREPFLRTFFLYVQFVHHDLLQAAVVWGVPGAALWLFLALGGWTRRLRSRFSDDPLLAAALVGSLVAVGLQSLMDFPLQIPSVQAGFLVVAALGWRE